jgi:acetolactate synthase-1/2/3 large subunit
VPDPACLAEAAEWLASARRPVVLAGQGVRLAAAEAPLRALVARGGGIPIAMSLLGLGVVPTASPTALGLVGHTGTQYANRAVHEADLLLVVGARLDVRQTGTRTDQFVPGGRVIRIDADPDELAHARVPCHLATLGDARLALEGIDAALAGRALPDWGPWRATTEAWRQAFPLPCRNGTGPLAPQYVVAAANRLTAGADAVVVSGVGSHQQWVARHFDFDQPRRAWLTSGGHGAMGFDLPAAIGAQLARPEALVLCFVGDGSLQINIQELQTAVDLGTPVKIVVLDNRRLGIVSQFQRLNWQRDPTTGDKRNPDFAAVARAYGIPAMSVTRAGEVEPALGWMLREPGPALVHCHVDPAEDVVPMLLAGQTMDRMWPYADAGGRP